jgi:hypothetical protein
VRAIFLTRNLFFGTLANYHSMKTSQVRAQLILFLICKEIACNLRRV